MSIKGKILIAAILILRFAIEFALYKYVPGIETYQHKIFYIFLTALFIYGFKSLCPGDWEKMKATSKALRANSPRGYVRGFLFLSMLFVASSSLAGAVKEYISKKHIGYHDIALPFDNEDKLAPEERPLAIKRLIHASATAVNEELLFRVLIAGAMLVSFRRVWLAIGLQALIFGACHGFIKGNAAEFAMATVPPAIAGIFYGYVYAYFGLLWGIFFHAFQDVMYLFASLEAVSHPLGLFIFASAFVGFCLEGVLLIRGAANRFSKA